MISDAIGLWRYAPRRMLRIFRDQKRAFDEAALDDYVTRATARIEREFSTDAAIMGVSTVHSLVELGVQCARRHGIEDEHGVDVYLNLMLQLGAELDVDPQLRWVAPILAEKSSHVAPLAVRLERAARTYLLAVAGRQYEHLRSAFGRLATVGIDDLPGDEHQILGWLSLIYPQKVAYLEQRGASALVERARSASHAHGLGDVHGHALYAALKLVLGSGFERDPALPWALASLRAARGAPHPARSTTLLERMGDDLQRYVE